MSHIAKPEKLLGKDGYGDEEFERLSAEERAKIHGYMWAQNLGGLIKPRSPDGEYGPFSLIFLTNEELQDWNKDEEQKYKFLDVNRAEILNRNAVCGAQSNAQNIIKYVRLYGDQ